MKGCTQSLFVALALLALSTFILPLSTAFAQGTAFTYQGRLNSGGAPANGTYDLQFTIYDSPTNGNVLGGPVTNSAVGVTNGLFTTLVDCGNVFASGSNWLEIAVSTNGANNFFTLTPRQQLTSVPYAITAANLSGVVSAAQLPVSVITNGRAVWTLPARLAATAAICRMSPPPR